jgi:hypothetical protein
MPDGSSSAAPVIIPGPSDFNSNRIHRDGANFGTTESECVPFLRIKAGIRSQSYMARRANRLFKVVQCDQTSSSAPSMMLCSEKVRHMPRVLAAAEPCRAFDLYSAPRRRWPSRLFFSRSRRSLRRNNDCRLCWYPGRYNAMDGFRMGNYSLLGYVGANVALEFLYSGSHSWLTRMHLNNTHGAPNPGSNP